MGGADLNGVVHSSGRSPGPSGPLTGHSLAHERGHEGGAAQGPNDTMAELAALRARGGVRNAVGPPTGGYASWAARATWRAARAVRRGGRSSIATSGARLSCAHRARASGGPAATSPSASATRRARMHGTRAWGWTRCGRGARAKPCGSCGPNGEGLNDAEDALADRGLLGHGPAHGPPPRCGGPCRAPGRAASSGLRSAPSARPDGGRGAHCPSWDGTLALWARRALPGSSGKRLDGLDVRHAEPELRLGEARQDRGAAVAGEGAHRALGPTRGRGPSRERLPAGRARIAGGGLPEARGPPALTRRRGTQACTNGPTCGPAAQPPQARCHGGCAGRAGGLGCLRSRRHGPGRRDGPVTPGAVTLVLGSGPARGTRDLAPARGSVGGQAALAPRA